MIKKGLAVAGGLMLVGFLFFGRDTISYISTSAGVVKDSVHDSVPIEFQIKRARDMIDDLVPEIRKNMHVIAREEVQIERLENQITSMEDRLAREKDELLRLKADLSSGDDVFQYAGRSYSEDQVRTDLARRFERYKTGEATLASLEEIHAARKRSLDAARQQLEGMWASKRQLAVEVENLEARLQMVQAARTTNDHQFDDSHLGRVKELISDLRSRLDVAERLANADTHFEGEIPLEETAPADIENQITEYFDPEGPEAEALAENEL